MNDEFWADALFVRSAEGLTTNVYRKNTYYFYSVTSLNSIQDSVKVRRFYSGKATGTE